METTDSEIITLLNDLIRINNDRIEVYERGETEIEDSELKSLFHSMSHESRKYRNEIIGEVIKLGGMPEEGTTIKGKLFIAWMDIKAAISEKNRDAIISTCEQCEEQVLEVYDSALNSGKLPEKKLRMVTQQHKALVANTERIKRMQEKIKVT
jgi:uncharacterized protein (TIGR02284 family)